MAIFCRDKTNHERMEQPWLLSWLLLCSHIPIIYSEIYLQTYRHDMTYSVLKVPLYPNQPTNRVVSQAGSGREAPCPVCYLRL